VGYAPQMSTPAHAANREGREIRLLLATIAISVGVLVLLARFRFPAEPADRPVESAPAPLERLAAEATYEELASIMADLERRLAPRLVVIRTTTSAGTPSLVVAPRMAPDRAVVLLREGDRIESANQGTAVEAVAHDAANGLHVLRVPAVDDGAVTIRTGLPRTGPRYVGVVEATSQGPVLRPVYVGRMQLVDDRRTGAQQLSLIALQQAIPSGAAIFTLEGAFIGLARDASDTTTRVVTGEFLRTAAASAPPVANGPRGWIGVELDPLTPQLTRATGADRGVVIAHVQSGGPGDKVLQPGDVVQSIDGTAVTGVHEFRQIEANRTPGASVSISGIRRGAPLDATVTAADVDAMKVVPPEGPGFIARDVARVGTEVVAVTPNSPAASGGLQTGDLIVALDGRQAPAMADIASRFGAAKSGTALLLTVRRGPRHHVIGLEQR